MEMHRLVASFLLFLAVAECRKTYGYHRRPWPPVREMPAAECGQELPNCAACLTVNGCSWCADEGEPPNGGECKLQENCLTPRAACEPIDDSVASEEKREPIPAASEAPTAAEIQNVTKNASVLCAEFGRGEGGCGACVRHDFCFWCEMTSSCHSYFNETTSRQSCPVGNWFKEQCIFPVGVLPCSQRNRTCHACLTDDLCYYCGTTTKCGYYPRKGYVPPHCPRDRLYHSECPYAGSLWMVLLPILAIILIPVLIYIFLWIVFCCMRAAGYEPLGDGSDQAPPGERKHRKGIRLKPGSPSSRTDTLRKKYKLDNP